MIQIALQHIDIYDQILLHDAIAIPFIIQNTGMNGGSFN
jgi:hypothetical protein